MLWQDCTFGMAQAVDKSRAMCVALLLALALALGASNELAASFGKYWDSGPDSQRIVVAITGDGYKLSEQTQLGSDAATIANAILTSSPWSTFANSMNVYIISAISSQSGADKPWLSQYVNTLFDGTYGYQGIQYCLVVDYTKVTTYLSNALQKYDVVIVVVNDSMYGGSGHNAAVTSTDPAMTNIILHELGHTFAGLEEEYEGNPGLYGGPEPSNPNVTTVTNPLLIKWKAWIDPLVPIPTTPPANYPTQVGLFQGALGYSQGIYRPMLRCMMRDMALPFCPVCEEAHVMRAHTLAPLVDSVAPGPGPIDVYDPLRFEALGDGWQYLQKTWKLDNVQISTGSSVSIHPGDILEPFSILDLSIIDNTPLIRSYPLPSAAYQWKLTPHVVSVPVIAHLRNMSPNWYRTSGVVSAVFVDQFYVQDADRIGGVRVIPYEGTLPTLGKTVTLCGKRDGNSFNLTLAACQWKEQSGSPQPPRPLGMSNKTLGGGVFGFQHGPQDGVGLNNVGLLVTTTGRVQVTDPNGFWMTIRDGSPFQTDVQGHPGTRVYGTNLTQYANNYVSVTGICIVDESNPTGPFPAAIRTRDGSDVIEVTE
jgi:hypothetical protein